jgi:hypothetical protein
VSAVLLDQTVQKMADKQKEVEAARAAEQAAKNEYVRVANTTRTMAGRQIVAPPMAGRTMRPGPGMVMAVRPIPPDPAAQRTLARWTGATRQRTQLENELLTLQNIGPLSPAGPDPGADARRQVIGWDVQAGVTPVDGRVPPGTSLTIAVPTQPGPVKVRDLVAPAFQKFVDPAVLDQDVKTE